MKLTTLLSAVLLVIGVVAGEETLFQPHQAIINSSCSNTLHQDLCFATFAAVPSDVKSKITSIKHVVEIALNYAKTKGEHQYAAIEEVLEKKGKIFTVRQKGALNDCLETIAESLKELQKVKDDLEEYPGKKSFKQHADDLKTLVSSAITNQETCLDGFSHDKADKKIRKAIQKGQVNVGKLCSNVLAIIKNMTDTDIANEESRMQLSNGGAARKLKAEEEGWPEWLSAGDRRLLQSGNVKANVVVAADGSGNYKTVSAAVAAAPSGSSQRYVIRIKAGVYRENVEVPSSKTNIMFMGDGRQTTIITAKRNVVDGATTFNSATVAVNGDKFLARDITFQNAAGPSKEQAVALRVSSDFSAFYGCNFIAYQDTLYVHINRQFYVKSQIVGTVDFIFGNAAVVIQDCDIVPRRPGPKQKNMLTAQGRTDPNQNTGIVIQKCRITANDDLKPVQSSFPTYLGRPWQIYSRTVVMQSSISDVIHPDGWYPWDGTKGLDTLYYAEYKNSGAGADTSRRVKWKGYKVITSASEAEAFTAGKFISGGSWLGSTGFPYSLGL